MAQHITARVAAAVAFACVAIAASTAAHADCCDRVRINNLTPCNFYATVFDLGGSVITDMNVYPMTSNARDIIPCTDVNVKIYDICGHRQQLPQTAGASIDILVAADCCVHVLCLDHCT